jgi:hypothetical protein
MITASSLELFEPAFLQHYEREFGFLLEGRALLVDDVRVRAVGKSDPAPTIQVSYITKLEQLSYCLILLSSHTTPRNCTMCSMEHTTQCSTF